MDHDVEARLQRSGLTNDEIKAVFEKFDALDADGQAGFRRWLDSVSDPDIKARYGGTDAQAPESVPVSEASGATGIGGVGAPGDPADAFTGSGAPGPDTGSAGPDAGAPAADTAAPVADAPGPDTGSAGPDAGGTVS